MMAQPSGLNLPSYSLPWATQPNHHNHLELLIQEQELVAGILQMHCIQAYPEGYTAWSTLLKLAEKYKVAQYIQPECAMC